MPPGTSADPRGGCRLVVLDKTITVRADPERVFGALRPGWGYDAGPAAPGRRFLHVTDALGARWTATTVVERVDPGRALDFRQVSGDYERFAGRYEVRPAQGGAEVRLRVELKLPFVLPRLTTEAEIRRAWSDRLDGALFRLKRALEG